MTVADRLSTYALRMFKLDRQINVGEQVLASTHQPLDFQHRVMKGK
jgi:hypothetical protein